MAKCHLLFFYKHMRSRTVTIISILFLSLGLIFILFKVTKVNEITPNEFTRNYKSVNLSTMASLDLTYTSFYIAGVSKNNIYLGNVSSPLYILKYNLTAQDTQQFYINTSLSRSLKSATITIDSPNFCIQDIVSRQLVSGDLNDTTQIHIIEKNIFFAEAISLSKQSNILRTLKNESKEYALAKTSVSGDAIDKNESLLEKQVEGLFSTDGMLHYSKEYNTLLYLYYYRNEFICIDTNLQLVARCHTIDSNTHAKIKISKISSKNQITMSAPPLIVNKKSRIDENKLYVLSPLLSKNESKQYFLNNSTIDVYNFTTCTYEYSFQIHDYRNKKMSDFEIKDNKVIAIFGNHLVIYEVGL